MSVKKMIVSTAVIGVLISASLVLFLFRTSAHQETGVAPERAAPPAGSRVLSPEARAIEKPLPETRLVDLEGKELPAAELRKGRALLVFLSSGCAPCVEDADAISRLLQNGSSPLRVYGVGVERQERVASFVKEHDFKFPFLLDKDAALKQALDVRIFPSKFLVEDGVVKKAWYGKTPDEARLRSQLALEEVK